MQRQLRMTPAARPEPGLPPQAMQTFAIKAPPSTHMRPATCAEVDCEQYRKGFRFPVLAGSDRAAYIRRAADGLIDGYRRRYIIVPDAAGRVQIVFPAGQFCFRVTAHRVKLDRPEFYLLRGGDWRVNTGLERRYERPDQWVDDYATNQDRLAHMIEGRP